MKPVVVYAPSLIAPCGINCGTCMANQRLKNKCLGCRFDFPSKRKTCVNCRIKNCESLKETGSGFCYECKVFPCEMIRHIDKRYRTKYRASLVGNLTEIRDSGMEKFLSAESARWTCPECGSTLSVHKLKCPDCSYSRS